MKQMLGEYVTLLDRWFQEWPEPLLPDFCQVQTIERIMPGTQIFSIYWPAEIIKQIQPHAFGTSFEIIAELQQPLNFPGKPTTWTARAMWHMAFSCVVAVLNFQGWIGGGLGELLNEGFEV